MFKFYYSRSLQGWQLIEVKGADSDGRKRAAWDPADTKWRKAHAPQKSQKLKGLDQMLQA